MSGWSEAGRAMPALAVVPDPVERVRPSIPTVVAALAVLASPALADEPSGLHVRING